MMHFMNKQLTKKKNLNTNKQYEAYRATSLPLNNVYKDSSRSSKNAFSTKSVTADAKKRGSILLNNTKFSSSNYISYHTSFSTIGAKLINNSLPFFEIIFDTAFTEKFEGKNFSC